MASPTHQVYAFLGGVPRRLPVGNSDAAIEARAAIDRELAELDATMLGRVADHRVPVDTNAIIERILERMDRYSTADWDRGSPSNLEAAQTAMSRILPHLRDGGGSTADDDEDEEND